MFLTKLVAWLTGHPWRVGLILFGLTLFASWSATGMRFDFAPQSIYAGRDDLVEDAQEFKQAFGYDDSVLQVILVAKGEPDVLEPEALDWQVSIAHDLDRLKDVVRVESLGSITTRKMQLSGRFGMSREPLIDVPADAGTESEVRSFLNRSHLVDGTLVGTDRKVSAVMVFFDPEMQSLDEMRSIVKRVKSTVRKNPPPEGYRTYVTGQAVLRVDIVKNLQSDQRSLIPLAGGLYLLALILVYRRVSGSVVPLLAVGIGLAWTMGVLAFSGQSFNLISNILPMLLLVLGISNSVHIISRYAEEAQETSDRRTAVERTMRHMAVACLLTFVTTAAGFLSLTTAHSDVIREFAWQAVLGLVLLYFAIVTTLSAALPRLRPPAARSRTAGGTFNLSRGLAHVAGLITRRPKIVLAGSLALMALALFAGRNVKNNSYAMETYDSTHPTLRAVRLVERRLSGLFPLEIDLRVDHPERLYQAEFAEKLAEFQHFAGSQEEVVFQRSYLDLLAELEPGLRRFVLNPTNAEAENLQTQLDTSRVRMGTAASEIGYAAFVAPDKKRARVMLKIHDEGTYRTGQLIERLEAKLRESFPKSSGVEFQITGDAYVITMAMDRLIRDLMISLLTACGVIFLIIALLFRSLRIGLLTALPNLTPLVLTLGYMGLRGFDMNAGNVIVFAISLGIAVDDTIHFLFRFREESKREPDPGRAVQAAMQGTGPAMILTSFLIVGGMAVLLFSEFVPTRRFAELLMVTMGGALVGDLLLLPACLVLFAKKPKPPADGSGERLEELEQKEPAELHQPVSVARLITETS